MYVSYHCLQKNKMIFHCCDWKDLLYHAAFKNIPKQKNCYPLGRRLGFSAYFWWSKKTPPVTLWISEGKRPWKIRLRKSSQAEIWFRIFRQIKMYPKINWLFIIKNNFLQKMINHLDNASGLRIFIFILTEINVRTEQTLFFTSLLMRTFSW